MTKFLRLAFAICTAITLQLTANSQSVGINTTGATANASSILDVSSNLKGVLIPRMTKTEKNAIPAPANGLLIYQTLPDSIGFHYFNGTIWVWLSNNSPLVDTINWKTHGNLGLTDSTSFFGNKDNVPLNFRQNNIKAGRVDNILANVFLGRLAGNDTATGQVNIGAFAGQKFKTNASGVNIGYGAGQNITGANNNNIGIFAGQGTTGSTGGDYNNFMGAAAGRLNKTGQGNIGIGQDALTSDTSGSLNTAVGFQAGLALDSAGYTTFIGTYSGYYNRNNYNTAVGGYSLTYNNFTTGSSTTGAENTGLGYGAGYEINLGSKNTAVGYQSMNGGGTYISGNRNVAVGDSSLFNFSTGNDNVAMGYKALSNAQTGSQSVAVGSSALRNFSGTYPNTAIGYLSMDSAATNGANTAVGSYSLTANKTGINNVALGNAAMYESTAGSDNTVVGNDAGRFIRANQNTAIGSASLRNDSIGSNNVAIGYQAAFTADSASAVIAIGTLALAFNRADSNIAIGYRAGRTLGSNLAYRPQEATLIGTFAGDAAFISDKNTAVGFRALAQRGADGVGTDYTSGGRNTAIGDSAMAYSVGVSNVAIGAQALPNAGVGAFQNVAIGDSAMGNANENNDALFDNVAIGYKSLTQVKNQGNVTIGSYSGQKLANSIWNTAIGYHALETDTTGSENTVIGTSAFRLNANGIRNVSLGINTGFNVTSSNNTYLGSYAGQGIANKSTGGSNTGVGDYALTNIRSGAQNVAVGENALGSDSSGNFNVAVGAGSMDQRLRGNDNTALGFWSGRLDSASARSVYIGREAGYNNQRDDIVAIGYQAMRNNTVGGTIADGVFNTAVGAQAMLNNTTGFWNTAVGYHSSSTNTTGNYNTALGFNALRATTASFNTAIGANNLGNSTTGGSNTAIGSAVMQGVLTGSNNIGIGPNALNAATGADNNIAMGTTSLLGNTTGDNNIGIGVSSLTTNSTGSNNVAVGHQALNITTADNNTALGYLAGNANTTGTSNTLIGYNADVTTGGLTNATAIGAGATVAQNNSLILGASGTSVGIGTTTPGALLDVSGTFTLGTNGTVLNEVIKILASGVTIPALTATGTNSFTISGIPGVVAGSTVSISPTAALSSGTVISYAYVVGAGTIQVFVNTPFAAGVASQVRSFYITVIR